MIVNLKSVSYFYLAYLFFLSLCLCDILDRKQIEFISKDFISNNEIQEIWKVGIEEHNRCRQFHGVAPLQGDLQLHQDAQKHADYLAKTNKVELSPYTQYGENLATSYASNKLDAVGDVVKRWYNRIVFYNFKNPEENQNRPSSGPFCSIVWKSTSFMGIGVARNKSQNKWVVVVLYDPDVGGINFGKNIPPPKLDYQNVVGLSVNFLVNQHPLNQNIMVFLHSFVIGS